MRPAPNSERLSTAAVQVALSQLPDWQALERQGVWVIEKTWRFADFHRVMAFANAVAGVAHAMNHHPDMQLSFQRCTVLYTTHDAAGLTLRDIDAAKRLDALPEGRQ